MPILFVSYDRGGAEIACAYYRVNLPGKEVIFVCDGPARPYFEQQMLPVRVLAMGPGFRTGLKALIENCKITEAYCSTGVTAYEREAMKELKANKIRTHALLEHWTNYRERFGFPREDWKDNLPDDVLVFDETAANIARSLGFPFERVHRVPNPSHALLKERFSAVARRIAPAAATFRILYLSDPVRDAAVKMHNDPDGYGFSETTLLRDIKKQVEMLRAPDIRLAIRTHPIETADKYLPFLTNTVTLSETEDLVEDLAESDMVIGCFSSALVSAVVVGRPSCSYIPESSAALLAPGMDLMHVTGLIRVNSTAALRDAIRGQYEIKFQPHGAIRSRGDGQ